MYIYVYRLTHAIRGGQIVKTENSLDGIFNRTRFFSGNTFCRCTNINQTHGWLDRKKYALANGLLYISVLLMKRYVHCDISKFIYERMP